MGKHLPGSFYVAVEGVLGAGKTTVARILAERIGGHALLEDVEANPFLSEFYRAPKHFVLETELAFVLIHYHQLRKAECDGLFNGPVIGDFLFEKDRLFAEVNLSGEDRDMFLALYASLSPRVRRPSAVIYLTASTSFLMSRIRSRGREMELSVEEEYLSRLEGAYRHFFAGGCEIPVITVDAETHDFLSDPESIVSLEGRLADAGIPGFSG